jgi:hypothetical protein
MKAHNSEAARLSDSSVTENVTDVERVLATVAQQ